MIERKKSNRRKAGHAVPTIMRSVPNEGQIQELKWDEYESASESIDEEIKKRAIRRRIELKPERASRGYIPTRKNLKNLTDTFTQNSVIFPPLLLSSVDPI